MFSEEEIKIPSIGSDPLWWVGTHPYLAAWRSVMASRSEREFANSSKSGLLTCSFISAIKIIWSPWLCANWMATLRSWRNAWRGLLSSLFLLKYRFCCLCMVPSPRLLLGIHVRYAVKILRVTLCLPRCLVHVQRPRPVGSCPDSIQLTAALSLTTCKHPPRWQAEEASSSLLYAREV